MHVKYEKSVLRSVFAWLSSEDLHWLVAKLVESEVIDGYPKKVCTCKSPSGTSQVEVSLISAHHTSEKTISYLVLCLLLPTARNIFSIQHRRCAAVHGVQPSSITAP